MNTKSLAELKEFGPKQRIAAGLLIVAVGALAIAYFMPPQRSTAAYCKLYKQEQAKLPHSGEDKYSAAMFTSSTNDTHGFAIAFGKLERVAPNDIQPDVKTLQQVFQKIDSDPSQAVGASLGGLSAESNVKDWTAGHCGS